jgi:hypothetical protein
MNARLHHFPVAVIGAGPVGLAAAAHLIQHGLTPIVLEAGPDIASNLESFRHVRLFSPWRYNIDRAARVLLDSSGWQAPDQEALPTAGEIVDHYLKPFAALPAIAPHVKVNHKVLRITRQGIDKVKTHGRDAVPFVLRVRTPEGEQEVFAQAVIDAAGTWTQPNPLGANGLPALNEERFTARISYGMPDTLGADRARYAGKRVLVVGAGHSAAGNLIALAELAEQAPGTTLVWAIRGQDLGKTFGGGAADGLPARGRLGMRLKQLQESGRLELHMNFRIHEFRERADGLDVIGEPHDGTVPVIERVEEIIAATGARPDLQMTRELRLRLDPWLESTDALAPLIDPNLHSCGTVPPHGHRELAHPEPRYYAIGAKSYGRAPNFLMATGYEQARSVVAALAGDSAAADHVQLELPETGVCTVRSLSGEGLDISASACCVGPAQSLQAESALPSSTAEGGCTGKLRSPHDACGTTVQNQKRERLGCGGGRSFCSS